MGGISPYEFSYDLRDKYQTEVSGTDGAQYRALRVGIGKATSGNLQPPDFIVMGKDANGNDQYILATPDLQNPGKYALKVDSELVFSGSTFIISNIMVMSADGTSGSLRYFRSNAEGSGAVFDAPFSSAMKFELEEFSASNVYELRAVSGTIETFSGATIYELLNLSASNKYELRAVSGTIETFSGATVYQMQALSGVLQKFSSSNDYDLRNISSSLTYELQAVSGVLQKFSGSNNYDLQQISTSMGVELRNLSSSMLDFSGATIHELRDLSGALKYETQAISGVLMLFSSSNDYDLRQISSSLTALDGALSGALVYELQAISGVLQKFSGSNDYDLRQLSSSLGAELRNLSSSLLDFSGATIHELRDLSGALKYEAQAISGALMTFSASNDYDLRQLSSSIGAELRNLSSSMLVISGALVHELQDISSSLLYETVAVDRYHQAASYSGTTAMLLFTSSLPAVDEGDAVPHRAATSDGAAAVAEQFYLNRSDEVTTHLVAHNTVSSGTVVTATAGTAVQFTATSTDACLICFTAYDTNQTQGCVGGSGVGARRAGVPVEPGETKKFPVNNVNLLYWNSNTVGDGGTWFRSYE